MKNDDSPKIISLHGPDILRVPVIRVRDKTDGRVHIVGSDSHDQLIIANNGCIYYRNMQNNETTLPGDDYEFVIANPDDGYMYNEACKWYTPARFKRLSD